MPLPLLARLPLLPDTMPLKVVLVSSPPVVSVALPSATLPAPANEPMLSLLPARLSVAPAATVMALASDRLSAAPLARVPAATVVAPLWLLVPVRVQVPAPVLVMPPLPDIAPLKLVLVPRPPVVSMPAPRAMLPAPATEPALSL